MPEPLSIESEPPDELRINSPAEIATYLSELHREGAHVLLSSPNGLALQTRVCAFDAHAELLGFEFGADPEGQAQALVADGEIAAATYLGSIKLQFELESPVLVSTDAGPILRSALPARLYRFQRRQAFRVQPASGVFPRVMLPLAEGAHAPVRVLDISVGGLALQLPLDLPGPHEGETLQDISLELDRTTQVRVDLRVQHVSELPGEAWRHLGCAFVEPVAALTRALQVYVDQTQKRRRLLRLDL